MWYPDIFSFYQQMLDRLYVHNPLLLPRPFPRSVFLGCTFNFGGNVCCVPHLDSNNLGGGICAIKALGR